MNKRLFYLIGFAIILAVEIIIGMYVHDRFVRPYTGDVLVVVLIYCFTRIFIPKGLSQLPFYVFAFVYFVEVPQYSQLVDALEITSLVTRIILGSTFGLEDIVSYVGGYVFVLLAECFWGKKGK